MQEFFLNIFFIEDFLRFCQHASFLAYWVLYLNHVVNFVDDLAIPEGLLINNVCNNKPETVQVGATRMAQYIHGNFLLENSRFSDENICGIITSCHIFI